MVAIAVIAFIRNLSQFEMYSSSVCPPSGDDISEEKLMSSFQKVF